MALIECPECEKMISDKAQFCPNCGLPFEETFSSEDIIDVQCPICKSNEIVERDGCRFCSLCGYVLSVTDKQAHDAYVNQVNLKKAESNNTIKCPKCHSTAITTGARGYKLLTGFLGSNQTVNRCGSCGHTWKPGR